MRRQVVDVSSDRIWMLDTSKKIHLPWLWSECIAWKNLPKNLCTSLYMIYNVREGMADVFYDLNEMNSCRKTLCDRLEANAEDIDVITSSCKSEHDKLIQVALDLDKVDLVSLPDATLYKLYDVILKQYTEFFKYSCILKLISKNEKLMTSFIERGISQDYIESAIVALMLSSNRLFLEISERLQRSEEFIMYMTPEEMECALHGGVFDELDVESRMKHYLLVYDLEKDNPHVYMDERARVMEISLKTKR